MGVELNLAHRRLRRQRADLAARAAAEGWRQLRAPEWSPARGLQSGTCLKVIVAGHLLRAAVGPPARQVDVGEIFARARLEIDRRPLEGVEGTVEEGAGRRSARIGRGPTPHTVDFVCDRTRPRTAARTGGLGRRRAPGSRSADHRQSPARSPRSRRPTDTGTRRSGHPTRTTCGCPLRRVRHLDEPLGVVVRQGDPPPPSSHHHGRHHGERSCSRLLEDHPAPSVSVHGDAMALRQPVWQGESTVAARLCLGRVRTLRRRPPGRPSPPATWSQRRTELSLRSWKIRIRRRVPDRTADDRLALAQPGSLQHELPLAAIVIPRPADSVRRPSRLVAASDALVVILSILANT